MVIVKIGFFWIEKGRSIPKRSKLFWKTEKNTRVE
jgi:hypothetical protein